jgi:drug/metabolite transporter (DMT)-like permease
MSGTSDTSRSQIDTPAALALVITLLPWASAFAGIRAGLEGYSPGALVLLRFLVASASLIIYALITHMRLPALRDLAALFLLGFLGITVYQVCLTFGEQSVSAGTASFLVATVPCFTALLAFFFLKERLSL